MNGRTKKKKDFYEMYYCPIFLSVPQQPKTKEFKG